jgi:hypothetical protein
MLTRFSDYVVVAVFVPVFLVLASPRLEGTERGGRQIVDGNRFEDRDYAFAIERPSANWAFYLEDNIHEIAPDACMGLVNMDTQGFFTVVPEQGHGVSLRDYTDRIIASLVLEDAKILHRELISVADVPAIEISMRGTVDGLDTAAVLFVLKRGDFFFQLTGWSLERRFPDNEPGFHELAASLEFFTSRAPHARATRAPLLEQHGSSWRIQGHRYASASHGYELEIAPSWRFASKSELRSINSSAAVGLISQETPVFQTQIVETVGELDRETITSRIVKEMKNRLGSEGRKISNRVVEVAGLPGREFVFAKSSAPEGPHVFLTVFYRNKQCFQLHSWWDAGDKDTCMTAVRKTYGFFSFLDELSRDHLNEQLARADADNAVGPGHSYRGGVYQNYEHGFAYHRPQGTWHGLTGTRARELVEQAALVLESPTHGIHVVVIPGQAGNISHQEYHQSRLRDMDAPSSTEIKTRSNDKREFLVSDFRVAIDDLPFRYVLCSTIRGDLAVDLIVYGFETNMACVDSMLLGILTGLRIPAQTPASRVVHENVLTDHRLGYRLGTDAPGWQVRSIPSDHLAAVSSMASLSSANVECVALGMCMDSISEELALNGMLNIAGGIGFQESSRSEEKDVLAGLPARRITLHGLNDLRKKVLTVWVARQANSLYGYLVIRDTDDASQSESAALEQCKSFLSLLD